MKSTQGQPAPTKPAEHESAFLKKNVTLINETARIFCISNNATVEERAGIRESWKKALETGHDWTMIKNRFGLTIINFAGFDGRLFEAIYDARLAKQIGRYAEAMKRVANLVDFRVNEFSPFEAADLVGIYYEKFSGDTNAVAPGDLMAAFQQIEKTFNPDIQTLEYWVDSSARRKHDRKKQEAAIQGAISEALDEGNAEDNIVGEHEPPDPRVELTSQLEAAQGRKTQAVTDEDFAAATVAKLEIAQLEAELAALDAKPEFAPALAPAPALVEAAPAAIPAPPTPAPVAPQPVAITATVPAPEPNGSALTQPTPASTDDDGAKFLKEVQASRLSKGVRDGLIAAFANGTAVDVLRGRLTTLNSMQK